MTGSLRFLVVVAILIGCSLGYPLATLTIGDLDIVVSTTKIKVTFCLPKFASISAVKACMSEYSIGTVHMRWSTTYIKGWIAMTIIKLVRFLSHRRKTTCHRVRIGIWLLCRTCHGSTAPHWVRMCEYAYEQAVKLCSRFVLLLAQAIWNWKKVSNECKASVRKVA